MELSFRSFTLFAAIIITGLSAGFFYAWAVSVIPGTRKIGDASYLETMQSINREILNPAFFIVFFGSLLLLIVSTVQHYQSGLPFWFMLAATLTYLVGTFGVTAFGNVPLNDALEAINLGALNASQAHTLRIEYEIPWNRLHLLRTVFSVLSFLFSLLTIFSYPKNI